MLLSLLLCLLVWLLLLMVIVSGDCNSVCCRLECYVCVLGKSPCPRTEPRVERMLVG